MKNYSVVTGTLLLENELYTTYGIKCENQTINDVSCNIDVTRKIVNALNDNDVSNVHFRDVVEDFLCVN